MKKDSPGFVFILIGSLLCLALTAVPQAPEGKEEIWQDYTAWIRTNPESTTLKAYGEKLAGEGMSQENIQAHLEIIRLIYKEGPLRSIEITYDRIFSRPTIGAMEKDGFSSLPSPFLQESAKELESKGHALDVGTGQGRNAVWLAQQGWTVTGIDISEGGLQAAAANAEKAGVQISTVKTSYQDFDFGTENWDLIVMVLSWAPVSETEFMDRILASLCPGGAVIFEHVLVTPKQQFPAYVQAISPTIGQNRF